jgi:hypothetical protein
MMDLLQMSDQRRQGNRGVFQVGQPLVPERPLRLASGDVGLAGFGTREAAAEASDPWTVVRFTVDRPRPAMPPPQHTVARPMGHAEVDPSFLAKFGEPGAWTD